MFVGIAFLVWIPTSAAAPPPNDDIANAQELAGLPVEVTGSNVDATREPGEPDHNGQGGERSIWFKWTAPRDVGVIPITTGCAPPFEEHVVNATTTAIYSGVSPFTPIEVSPFRPIEVDQRFLASAGHTYWIAVASSVGAGPDPDICLRLVPTLGNDDFVSATPLTGFPVTVRRTSGSTSVDAGGATVERGEPAHAGRTAWASLWYSWTARSTGPVWVRLCGPFDILAIYTGDRLDALSPVAAGRNDGSACGDRFGMIALVNALQGATYRIALAATYSAGFDNVSPFTLIIGNQLVVAPGGLSYRAFPGQRDKLKVRLVGAGARRAFLVDAPGVAAAAGCESGLAAALRCPAPGRRAPGLDIRLGDGDDSASVRVLSRLPPRDPDRDPLQIVAGGAGDDTLHGSTRLSLPPALLADGLRLVGGPGRDHLLGATGSQHLKGQEGADTLSGGASPDLLEGGPGNDRLDPGRGMDGVDGSGGNDTVRAADGFTDAVGCADGRDRARLDGIDFAGRCERRTLATVPRAFATLALISDAGGLSDPYLVLRVGCPVDAPRACPAVVSVYAPGGRRVSRTVSLPPDRLRDLVFFRFDERRLLHRDLRVAIATKRPGRRPLRFATRLPVVDGR